MVLLLSPKFTNVDRSCILSMMMNNIVQKSLPIVLFNDDSTYTRRHLCSDDSIIGLFKDIPSILCFFPVID
jgi:hypothetical protein